MKLNQTLTGQKTEDDTIIDIVCIVLMATTTLLIVTLNPLCLVVLHHVESIQATTKVFLRSMSSAAIGTGIFMAFPMTVSAISQRWLFGEALCGIQSFVVVPFFCESVLSILYLTVDRYLSVVYALQYSTLVTVKRARIAVCCKWAALVLLPIILGFIAEWKTVYSGQDRLCGFHLEKVGLLLIQAVYTCTTVVSLLIILVAYTKMMLISRQHARRIHADNQLGNQPLGNHPVAPQNNKSLHTLLFIILTAFVLNLLPLLYVTALEFYSERNSNLLSLFMFQLPPLTVSWLNAIVYYLRNTGFRKVAFRLLIGQYQYCRRHIPFRTG